MSQKSQTIGNCVPPITQAKKCYPAPKIPDSVYIDTVELLFIENNRHSVPYRRIASRLKEVSTTAHRRLSSIAEDGKIRKIIKKDRKVYFMPIAKNSLMFQYLKNTCLCIKCKHATTISCGWIGKNKKEGIVFSQGLSKNSVFVFYCTRYKRGKLPHLKERKIDYE